MELIVPTDPDDRMCVTEFRNNLLEICEARNNNAQLTTGTKANQKGYFDTLSQQLRLQNKQIADRVEWKSNDGGDAPIQNLIALTWIPLTLIPPVSDANTLQWKTSPQNFVEQHFDEIMRQYYMNLTACQYDPQKSAKCQAVTARPATHTKWRSQVLAGKALWIMKGVNMECCMSRSKVSTC